MNACSTTHLFHALLNPAGGLVETIIQNGLRPLSDFPDNDRWLEIEAESPKFFEQIYSMIAQPVLKRPYENSGVFLSPIDFQKMPDSLMHNKTRVSIPVDRIDSDYAVLTYVLNGERVNLPFNKETLEESAQIWNLEEIEKWFAKDRTKIFYYVPQIVTYQPDGVVVHQADIECRN